MAKLQGLLNTNKVSLPVKEFLLFGIPLFLFFFISNYKSISDAYYLWFITPLVCLIITFLFLFKNFYFLKINWVILSYLLLHCFLICFRNQIFLFNSFLYTDFVIIFFVIFCGSNLNNKNLIYISAVFFCFFIFDELQFEWAQLFSFSSPLIGRSGSSIFLGETLTFSLPLFYFVFVNTTHKFKIYIFLVLVFVTLFIIFRTNSRASYIAVLICLLTLFPWNNLYKLKKYLLGVSFLGIVFLIIYFLVFFHKYQSSMGRLLILKISLTKINDYIILGTGLGGIHKNYLIWQEEYFTSKIASLNEQIIADNVYFIYNEYLKSLIEGGFIGFFIFLIPIYFIIKDSKNSPFKNCFLRILVIYYTLSSFTNIGNTFIGSFFYFYSVTIITPNNVILKFKSIYLRYFISIVIFTVILITIKQIYFNYKWGEALKNYFNNNNDLALIEMEKIHPYMVDNAAFLFNYGSILAISKKNEKALEVLFNANLLMKRSNLYDNIGGVYFQQKNYDESIKYFQKSSYMVPNRFYPLSMILKSQIILKQDSNACITANLIINKPIKIPSQTIESIITHSSNYVRLNCK